MTGYPKGATLALGWMLTLTVLIGLAPVALADVADHLILSEIVVKTRTPFSTFGSPYIQVVNPTATDVDMGQVYITDATTSPSAFYYNLPLGDPGTHNPGGGNGGDFHARFPDGYVLAAGDSLAISINGSVEYQAAYGRLPDFELFEDAILPDTVPELVEVFPGSIDAGPHGGANVPALSDIAESIVLYSWDGVSDLVQDLDYVMWGSNTGVRFNKSDVTIGADTYLDDTLVISQNPVASAGPGFRHSFRRLDADEGTETTSGGNGLGGHDETSEDLDNTWQDVDFGGNLGVPSAPESLHPAAPIFSAAGHDPMAPYDGQEVELSATLVSNSTLGDVIFHYSIDGGAYNDLMGSASGGDFVATVPAQVEGAVLTWYCTAGNTDGAVAVYPAAAPAYFSTWTVSEAPDPSLFPSKLLLTEICTKGTPEEFIEIYNPSDEDVDMSDYYLGDAVYNDQGYWNIGGGATNATIGGGTYTDFQARFPDEFVIDAGDTIVVSVAGSAGFSASYGFLPDLELFEDDAFPDLVPDMRPVFETAEGNSIITLTGDNPSTPTLTNGGESIALYHWREGDALATDIDLFLWGTGGSYEINKTGRTVAGSMYLPDNPAGLFTEEADFGTSYTRVDGSEGTQIPSGSNGVLGRDETSENISVTFELLAVSPSRPSVGGGGGGSGIELVVEAKTFIPTMGEVFPIRFVSKSQSETKLRLLDLEGRVVYTLWDSRRNGSPSVIPGVYTTVAWDGRNEIYERVRAGMYILHLSVVDSRTGELETQTAPVVVATRLSR